MSDKDEVRALRETVVELVKAVEADRLIARKRIAALEEKLARLDKEMGETFVQVMSLLAWRRGQGQ